MNNNWKNLIRVTLAFTMLSLSALACGGSEEPTPTATARPVDTPPATSAIEEPTATPTPSAPAGGRVSVDALWFAQDASGPFGGTSRVVVEVEPAAEPGDLRVGFFEEEVMGTGDMWHAAGWTAVTLASMLLGIDPAQYEFSFSVGGRIDGPSAGGLMTVGVLAALLGDTVDEEAAMTGTINPDGTIGPVGGIPHKIAGAAEAGKTLVLVPAGQRHSMDYGSGEYVDVVEVGERLGVEVREVSTIYEAYHILTGSELPRPEVTRAAPQLPSRAFDRVQAKAREWYNRYLDERNQFSARLPEIQDALAAEVAEVDELAARADSAIQQGMPSVAYSRAWQAAAMMGIYNLAADILTQYLTVGLDSTIAYLNSTAVAQGEVDAMLDMLETMEPETVGDCLTLFEAYGDVDMAQGLIVIGNDTINNLVNNLDSYTEEEILVELTKAALYFSLARSGVELARDAVDIGMGFGSSPAPDPEIIAALSNTLRRASDANIAYFESVIVDQYAEAWGVHPDRARAAFMYFESDYQWVKAVNYGIALLADTQPVEIIEGPLTMGGSFNTYRMSAGLVAKYYSLDTQLDEDGNVVSIGNERALADMLQFADERAVELINLNGEDVPVMAVMYYEDARILRQGTPEDQMDALKEYWTAATMALVQAYLTGRLGQ